MDTAMLQTPRTGGRSRFSKALPMPPPSQNTFEPTSPARQVPRALPDFPSMTNSAAFPPRKDSVGARFTPKPIDSPLPALPAKSPEPETQKKMPPIPRKAVASPPAAAFSSPPAEPAQVETTDLAKLKRNSSISSLLSAYSNTSSDSVHRSSQGGSDTKGSEASLSPEREERPGNFARNYRAYSRNPYEEPSAQEKEMMMHEPLPPPPPMKDANGSSRPTTPRVGLPATPRHGRPAVVPPPKDDDTSSSVTVTNASPPRREIWRRRASSKSDGSIAVTGLKLAVSHGSTAETAVPLPAPAAGPTQDSLPDPSGLNPSLNANVNKTSPLPPRSSSALPGRNIKPQSQQPSTGMKAPAIDSPTLKTESASFPTNSSAPGRNNATPSAKPSPGPVSPLSSPEPPAKSMKRREVGTKSSVQNMRGTEASPAQHLREARSQIDLRAARAQQEAAQENFPFEGSQIRDDHVREGVPSPRARRPSNTNERRLAAAPQLTVTSPSITAVSSGPVEYKDQEPMQLTPREEKTLMDAIAKVTNRDWAKAVPNKQGVWTCKELTSDHLTCASDHKRWLHMENLHNPISCMLCHLGGRDHRRVCKTCGMRVCIPCADLLSGHKIGELDFVALVSKTKANETTIAEE
ncbi:hypothetical protein SCAR479_01819 [Seiridium cardinale]|uniref:FYVE-type domain-containing protein n=1 Tax=Seiridium cardinale TaxID=138064 RepID=A0ABR2Y6H9_9PEZI